MMANLYLIIKALHLISLISWMAGMFYLPRLYVYHTQCKPGSEASEMLKVMEHRLLRIIINPAMVLTWIFGLWLIHLDGGLNYLKTAGWLHVKLIFVVAMMVCHVLFARWRRAFAEDRNLHSAKFYRILNEVPTLLMIVIVLLAVTKPF